MGGLDDSDGDGSPEIMPFAAVTLRVQMVILGLELQRDFGLLFVGHHQVQILTVSAANEGRLARIKS